MGTGGVGPDVWTRIRGCIEDFAPESVESVCQAIVNVITNCIKGDESSSETDEEFEPPIIRYEPEFRVVLDGVAKSTIGLDVDFLDGQFLCVSTVRKGAILEWNETVERAYRVRKGDRITRINDSHGNSLSLLRCLHEWNRTATQGMPVIRQDSEGGSSSEEIEDEADPGEKIEGAKSQRLEIWVNRPVETRIYAFKGTGEPIGVQVDYVMNGTSLRISGIGRGVVHNWNKLNPTQAVKINDRIISVNRETAFATRLMKEMRNADNLQLVILRYPSLGSTKEDM